MDHVQAGVFGLVAQILEAAQRDRAEDTDEHGDGDHFDQGETGLSVKIGHRIAMRDRGLI